MTHAALLPIKTGAPYRRVGAMLVTFVVLAFVAWLLKGRFDLATLKALLAPLLSAKASAPVAFTSLYFAAYVAATGLCIPLEVPFALLAGAIFGLAEGVIISSFASIFGATLAFLATRFLLRDRMARYFGAQLKVANQGIERDGVFYLINMRLTPIIPFTLCNILMGLTTMPVRVFFVVSQACMIFATIIFVNAGTQLLNLRTFGDIMSPGVLAGFVALALLPWLARGLLRGIDTLRRRTRMVK